MSALEVVDPAVLWSAVDELVDRAPGHGDLQAHGLQLLAGARLRSLGSPVPEQVALEERHAAFAALAVPAVLQRARAAYDGQLMIMKGAEVALHYRDPSLRSFNDVDLLADDADAAQRALVAAGFVELGTEVNDIGIHLCPLAWPGLPMRIELHRRPRWVEGLGQPSLDELFDAAEPSGLGVDGILAPARHHHALLVAAHAWNHEPLRRVSDLIDIAVLAGPDRAAVRELAQRWGCERLWATTERTVDAMLYGAARPVALRTWARHLFSARERTVLETRILRITGPAWAMPRRRIPRALLGACVWYLSRHDGESWRMKLARTGKLARHAARPRSELQHLVQSTPEGISNA